MVVAPRTQAPARLRRFLARGWKPSPLLCIVIYLFCVVSGVFDWPLLPILAPEAAARVLLITGLAVLALMGYVPLAGSACGAEARRAW